MAELKTKLTDEDPTSFIQSIPDETQRSDCLQLLTMMTEITGKRPRMWGAAIIGFDTYSYKYASGQSGDWFPIGFSPRKGKITIYCMSGYDEVAGLLDKLGKHSTAKSCLYIKKLTEVDIKVLKNILSQCYTSFMKDNS